MDVALVSRFAWPRVGGTETLVRDLGASLADLKLGVRAFAHRIDDGDITGVGGLDRSAPFPPVRDPVSGTVTRQLRLSRPAALVLATTHVATSVMGGRECFEWLHARSAARQFASQISDADVVHRFGGNRVCLATVLAARRIGAAAVVTPLAHPGQWDDDEVSARGYRAADLVLATSRADAETYLRLGVDERRVEICALPTRAHEFGSGLDLRERERIDGPLVLFLGARRSHKGVEVLLAAGEILARSHPDARIAFVGPGDRLESRAPVFRDVGQVTDAERSAWLDAADVVCLPSRAESFGLVVSEAWSARTPVVTSDIPVLKERVEESGGGAAVPASPQSLADALGSLLDDRRLRSTMGEAGWRNWQARLATPRVADRHAALYRDVIEGRR